MFEKRHSIAICLALFSLGTDLCADSCAHTTRRLSSIIFDVVETGVSVVRLNKVEDYNFNGLRSVLFLSDGAEVGRHRNRVPSGPLIVSSDFQVSGFSDLILDNNRLPLRDDSVDAVVMKRGLCSHKGGEFSCGGIRNSLNGFEDFFRNVTRLLRKDSPSAIAVLTGPLYSPPNFAYSINGFVIHTLVNEGKFIGVVLLPPGVDLAKRLRELVAPTSVSSRRW